MTAPKSDPPPRRSSSKPDKAERLAAKLRENLKRRKQQVRERGLDPASATKTGFKIDRDGD